MEVENRMVLYSVVTTYHLLEAMVHKLSSNNEKEGILLLSQWLANKYPWYSELNCIFDKVIVFNAHYQYHVNTIRELNNYFASIFDKEYVNVFEMEEIHVFGAEHSFGTYIFANEIQNYYWEEGAGALSKKESMLEIFEKVHGKEKAKFQYELHLGDGETTFVKNRFFDKYFQLKEVEGDNLVHFDLAEELSKLDEKKRNEIVTLFYGEEKIITDKNAALLLTEHFANLSTMTWEEQEYLYKYLVDYFLSEYDLLVKPHPDDLMYYEYIFKQCNTIRTKFPAELLPFIFEGKPSVVATSSSTSIYGLRSQFDKVLEFNFKFSHEKQFYRLNRYFVTLKLADKLMKESWKLKLVGVNSVIVDNFNRFYGWGAEQYEDRGPDISKIESDMEAKTVWIVDEIENPHGNAKKVCEFLNKLPEESVVFFVNSDENYCFYDYNSRELWNNVIPVEIVEKALSEVDNTVTLAGPQLNEDKTEKLFIYQKGVELEMYEIKKELPNVGISVNAQSFDGDKYQVKILEGMLEATEKRLLYYIEREKELLAELEEKK